MVTKMSPELWYELERIENAWFEIGTRQLSLAHHERIVRLKELVKFGYARWLEHADGRHGFFQITDDGRRALTVHRRQEAEKPGASPPPQAP